ncbi:MAG: hypothetical protein OXU73_00925 [Candidatus Campbellbacteria bacterium]|nr:hypothetical protein [Candidatus Campbellbacteria bacterium]
MNEVKLFRGLILTHIVLIIISALVNVRNDFSNLTKEEYDAIAETGVSAVMNYELALFFISIILLIVGVASWIGMFMLRNWGRVLYSIVFVISFVAIYIGIYVVNVYLVEVPDLITGALDGREGVSAFDTVLDSVGLALSGAIVAMSWTALKDRFK